MDPDQATRARISDRHDPHKVNSLVLRGDEQAVDGSIVWEPKHSLWNGAMLIAAATLRPIYFSWAGFFTFLGVGAVTLCMGHSVGYHRRLIHRSFQCSKPVERALVWLGAMVGMGGPLWTIRTHDTRDWAQRQACCNDYYAHRHGWLRDLWGNLHCRFVLDRPPQFDPGPGIVDDWFYRFLERTWMLHQIPLGLLLYATGGMPCLAWGLCVRVATCTTMHWFVTRLAHTQGPQQWLVDGAGVQAHNVPFLAIPTFGEAWHNNHHAFPASARHGLYRRQLDIGFGFIQLLEALGLVWDVKAPDNLPERAGLSFVPSLHEHHANTASESAP